MSVRSAAAAEKGPSDVAKRVLFYRDFRALQGGHIVHAQYMRLVAAMPGYDVRLFLTPESAPIAESPWASFADRCERSWNPDEADIHFVAGLDWRAYPRERALENERPFINLIQGVRHADPENPLHAFLDRRALRICVSDEVHAALEATGRCNGLIVTIANALTPDVAELHGVRKDVSVAIVAIKQPALAEELAEALRRTGIGVEVVHRCERGAFLERLARARLVVALPLAREGFYLPALEAMALGCIVVCPDCVGNRGYCHDGLNCIVPREYTAAAIVGSVRAALSLSDEARAALLSAAGATATAHGEARIAAGLATVFEEL